MGNGGTAPVGSYDEALGAGPERPFDVLEGNGAVGEADELPGPVGERPGMAFELGDDLTRAR